MRVTVSGVRVRFPLNACCLAAMALSRLEAMSPSPPDEHTLHHWHLDEAGPPFADHGTSPKSLLGLLNGALANQESYPGFGRAVSFDHSAGGEPLTTSLRGALLLAQPQSVEGPADNVTAPFPIMGRDGAFTIEALVKFNRLPADAPGVALDVVSMDGEWTNRVFNFRIEKPGFLTFIPFAGLKVRGGGLATIPLAGPHAINTRDWFHLAVTYDGNDGAPGNLKLYWTRVAAGLAAANQIGSGSLAADLSTKLGDFAIGNTGRTIYGRGECNPFPGLIDEVRISSIARQAEDFFFVTPEAKAAAARMSGNRDATSELFQLGVRQVLVDGNAAALPTDSEPLVLAPGLHRIDIDFALVPGKVTNPLEVRCRLEGIDDSWRPALRGMSLICEVLGDGSEVVSRIAFESNGQSAGWVGDPNEARLQPRLEPLFFPENARALRIILSSGTPDTTGQWVIDQLAIHLPGDSGEAASLWQNGSFERGLRVDTLGGLPDGWKRGGDDPAIAPLVQHQGGKALGLADGSQTMAGFWIGEQPLPKIPASGVSALLSWQEAYNVIGGGAHRATYLNVPPGSYMFRASAVTDKPQPAGTHLELPILVRQSLWQTPWFWPVSASLGVGLLALVVLQTYRRRALARLSKLELQHTLERDRARIARDLHDDLGTRVSSLMMGTSLVQRDLERDSAAARRHLTRMSASARELVAAMDELVWAVDPANDTLDRLASHLAGMAQEMFRDSEIRVRISVPVELPATPLRSDFRHHFSLAVKEALHNVLKHAGPCEVSFELHVSAGEITALIRDDGHGFDPADPEEGNGLLNLQSRLAELGGSCEIVSSPSAGTTVTLRCPLEMFFLPPSS
jgi:signal transduction histidine kinase